MSRKRPSNVVDLPGAVQPPTREFLQHLEEQATQLRRRAGVGPLDRLDPWAVLEPLGLTIVTPDDIAAMTPEQRARVRTVTPKEWSGTGMPLPDGQLLVLLHPEQTPERATVTVLEEVAHTHYDHPPTQIVTLPSGVVKRTFNARNEQEAYWTAAAALLPMKAVGLAVWHGQTAADLVLHLANPCRVRPRWLARWRPVMVLRAARPSDRRGAGG